MKKKIACKRVLRVAIALVVFGFFAGGCKSLQMQQQIKQAANRGDVDFLMERLTNVKTPYKTSYYAANALSEVGTPAVEPLIAVLKDLSVGAGFRKEAARALGRIGDSRAVDPLIAAMKDDYFLLQTQAIEALGEIGDARAVDPLIDAFNDATLIKYAAWALGKIGEPAVDPLILLLMNENSIKRLNAAIALGDIGDERAVAPLISTLVDEDPDVRRVASWALKKIRR